MLLLACLPQAGAIATAGVQVGDLIVAEGNNGYGRGSVVAVNPTTGLQRTVSIDGWLDQPSAVCVDASNGTLLVADYGGVGQYPLGSIIRINPANGQQALVASGGSLLHPTGVQVDPRDGSILVAQAGKQASFESDIPAALLRINPATGAVATVSTGGPIDYPEGVLVSPTSGYLISGLGAPDGVMAVSPTGTQTSVAGPFSFSPRGMCVDLTQDHSLLLVGGGLPGSGTSALYRIDTLTGAATPLSIGGNLENPHGVAQDAASPGIAYVTEGLITGRSASIIAIDLQTGAQTVVTSDALLYTPLGVAVYVPEPTAGLSLLALGGAALLRRRRRRQRA
jgi:hypothetical protein